MCVLPHIHDRIPHTPNNHASDTQPLGTWLNTHCLTTPPQPTVGTGCHTPDGTPVTPYVCSSTAAKLAHGIQLQSYTPRALPTHAFEIPSYDTGQQAQLTQCATKLKSHQQPLSPDHQQRQCAVKCIASAPSFPPPHTPVSKSRKVVHPTMPCRHAKPTLEAHCVCQHQQRHASQCNTTHNPYAAYHHPVTHQATAPTPLAYAAYAQKAAHQEAAQIGSQAILRNISSVESTRLSAALNKAALPSTGQLD